VTTIPYRAWLAGTGHLLPERVLTNHDLEKIVDTSDQWITERTGIKERRIAADGETLADYAVPASENALEMAGIAAEELDLILCATVTPDWHLPASACFIQERLQARKAVAFDLAAGCSGWLYGLGVAEQFVRTGSCRHALVIGAELLSKFIDWQDRTTCILFADGAGAAVVSRAEGNGPSEILGTRMHTNGALTDFISIPGGGAQHPPSEEMLRNRMHYIKMKGQETFKLAVRHLTGVCREVLEEHGRKAEDVKLFVPHQANMRIISAVGDRLKIPRERIVVNVERTGNTSAASIPIALDEANRAGQVSRGDLVLLAAFGAGLTWAATLAVW
jgi:3-oxoacyl-[acyl-carrier-protein] synthase-3